MYITISHHMVIWHSQSQPTRWWGRSTDRSGLHVTKCGSATGKGKPLDTIITQVTSLQGCPESSHSHLVPLY